MMASGNELVTRIKEIRVFGLVDKDYVKLFSKENAHGYYKGELVHTCSRSSYNKMREPLEVRIFPSGRIECIHNGS